MAKIIIAFGNPLIDTSVMIHDHVLLDKYNLKIDGQKEITSTEMNSLLNDIKNFDRNITSGGCAQNTLKIMKWLMQDECRATMFGSIADDKNGLLLQKFLKNDGVQAKYFIHHSNDENIQTGTSVALVHGENRSLVAHLGAAELLPFEDFINSCGITAAIDQADIIYMEGFFLAKRAEIAEFIADYCNKHCKQLVFNISGEYICHQEPEAVSSLAKKCDILFGNKDEFRALSSMMMMMSHQQQQQQQQMTNTKTLVNDLCKSKDGKIVVITNGRLPVLCKFNNETFKFTVPVIEDSEIVDTTGAGDAFVAGFLSGYLLRQTLMKSIETGCFAASEIIKQRGCIVPDRDANIISIFGRKSK